MITAYEARELNGYNKKIQNYIEIIDAAIRYSAKEGKNQIMYKLDSKYALDIVDELQNAGYDIRYGTCDIFTILIISW